MNASEPMILESPDEVLSTLTRDGKRRWIYPTPSPGRFLDARRVVAWVLIVLYVALPLIPINGRPAVLLDFIHREFALFGVVFYPTDTLLLMIALIGILLSVVLVTAVLGRVWCGWACPQTVYLEFVFRPIERLVEGKEHVRKRRNEGPLTLDKAWRKSVKYALYTAITLVLAHSFVAYFVGWGQLIQWMTGPPAEHWGFFVLMAGTSALVLFNFAYFREQMCTITCPYARMQSVLLDRDSLIVSYDPTRGEPRARRGKARIREEEDGLVPAFGDCIDCAACVRTCPTGIDIREGLQMECVACTQCIDACDTIMDRIGKPRGLIRYTSERALEGNPRGLLRTRTALYGLLLIGVLSAFTIVLINREAYDLNVARVVGAPYTELPDGQVANRLRFRVRNQTPLASGFSVRVDAPEGAQLRPVGAMPVTLAPGQMERLETWVTAPDSAFSSGTAEAVLTIEFLDGSSRQTTFTLLGPSRP